MAPAKTGRDSKSKMAVTSTAHGNIGIISRSIPIVRRFIIVVIKFTAPNSEEIPAKCRLKIAKSTDGPLWNIAFLRGGYTVQPVPAPDSIMELSRSSANAGSKNQNLILFSRGKAMSGAPIIRGTSQLPKKPIKIGMTMKKIIMKACAVTITL